MNNVSSELLDDYLHRGFAVLNDVSHVLFGDRNASARIRLYTHAVDEYGGTLAVLVVGVVVGCEAVIVFGTVEIHLLTVRTLVASDLRIDYAVVVLLASACICVRRDRRVYELCARIALYAERGPYSENSERRFGIAFLCLSGAVKSYVSITLACDPPVGLSVFAGLPPAA